MNDFHPWRSTRPNPWPRRIVLAVAAAALALSVYVLSARADSGLDPTTKPWPPSKPSYTAVCRYRPEAVSAVQCYRPNSRRPYRP